MIDGKVLVTRRIDPDAIVLLEQEFTEVDVWEHSSPPTPEELRSRVQGCVALVTMVTDRVDGQLLDCAPDLRVIANVATGYDNFDVKAAAERNVILANTPGVVERATADLAFALLLAASRRIMEAADDARAGRWGPWSPWSWLGHDVHSKTLGIVGLGKIGREVALRAAGFRMKIFYTARNRVIDDDRLGVEYVPDLSKLLNESDFVSLHVPLNPLTSNLMDSSAFRAMKSTAFLINTSRGGVVDHDALVAALHAGHLQGAALDVTNPEPLPPDHVLYQMPNVLITPHIGSASIAARRLMCVTAARNAIAACSGIEFEGLIRDVP